MPVMERFATGEAVCDERTGMSVSGWLAQAAADRLRNDLLDALTVNADVIGA